MRIDIVVLILDKLRTRLYYTILLKISSHMTGTIAEKLYEINSVIKSNENFNEDIFNFIAGTELQSLWPIINQAEILAKKYDCVVANPPYMGGKGLNPALKNFLKINYTKFNSDLFSTFIVRNSGLSKYDGYLGFMSPFVWMFISSYEKLRDIVINQQAITSLVQLEYSGFDGATVPICTFTLKNRPQQNFIGSYIRLSDFRGSENQAPKTLEAIQNPDCGWYYQAQTIDFRKIPGSPIAYWVSERVKTIFEEGEPLANIAPAKIGMRTGNNERFLRFWHEVSANQLALGFKNAIEAEKSEKKWFPYNKGGSFRKWYGNNEYVVNWLNNGHEIKENTIANYPQLSWDNLGWKISNEKYYFLPAITWTATSSSHFGVRKSFEGFLFDVKGSCCFPEPKSYELILGFLASKQVRFFLKFLNPTIEYQTRDIGNLPIIESILNDENSVEIKNCVKKLIEISKYDWDNYEISWDFSS